MTLTNNSSADIKNLAANLPKQEANTLKECAEIRQNTIIPLNANFETIIESCQPVMKQMSDNINQVAIDLEKQASDSSAELNSQQINEVIAIFEKDINSAEPMIKNIKDSIASLYTAENNIQKLYKTIKNPSKYATDTIKVFLSRDESFELIIQVLSIIESNTLALKEQINILKCVVSSNNSSPQASTTNPVSLATNASSLYSNYHPAKKSNYQSTAPATLDSKDNKKGNNDGVNAATLYNKLD